MSGIKASSTLASGSHGFVRAAGGNPGRVWFYFPLLAMLLAGASGAIAQDSNPAASAQQVRGGGAPAQTPGAPVDADVETLRKLLGVAPAVAPKPMFPPAPAARPPAPVEAAPPTPPVEAKPAEAEPVEARPAEAVPAPAAVEAEPAVKEEPVKAAPAKPAAKPAVTKTKRPTKTVRPQTVKKPVPAPEPAAEEVQAEEPPPPPVPLPGSAEDVPADGTVISGEDIERWKHLLIPGQQWALARGATMKVVRRQPIVWEPKRLEATERYHSQVRLAANKLRMENYVAGQPFPVVDPEDPDAGIKLVFDYEARVTIDDVDVRNFACTTGSLDTRTGMRVERDFRNPHFRRLSYVARLYQEPMPTWHNSEGLRSREMMSVSEPFDLKGAGFSYARFLDTSRPDDSWLYYPQTKRLRRLSTAQRSEGVFGQDIDLDSYAGFSGAPAWSEWRLLGVKTVLASMHAQNLPVQWLPPPADFVFDDVWEPREVYVLEGRSRLPGYAFSRRILYLDRESFLIPMNEIYDLKGNLWKSEIQAWKFGHKPRPDAVRAVYEPELGYLPGFVLFDMQFNHATRCELPARDAGREEGWYYNFGDAEGTTEEAFLVAAFIGSGR